ncbi:hypothetical protein TNCV_3264801 [Trichonephila clavipes]|nr:hypothetical protein TNCV_3264801 [Trichonephila clavipes]
MLYRRMVLEPHTVYPIPAGTRYILLLVQKTVFETNKRPLVEQSGPSSQRSRVFITPVIRPSLAPVLIARPSTALASPQTVIIPEPPVQIPPVQIPATPELTTPLVQIPDPPVQITVFQPPLQIPVFQPPVQIPVFQPPVQIPVFQPHVQIPVFQPPVQIPPVQLFLPDAPVKIL